MKQTILPFKLEKTDVLITPNAGLAIYLEIYRAVKVNQSVRELFPKPGSAKGFYANNYVLSILILFLAGGKYIEDIRKIKLDKALKKVGELATIPSADAIGDWMRTNSQIKIQALEQINKRLIKRFLKKLIRKEHTLDIDAFEITSGKVVKHAGSLWLKLSGVSDDLYLIFSRARRLCWNYAFSP